MKTAKEWAAEVVIGADRETGRTLSRLQDPQDEELYVWLREQSSWPAEIQKADDARAIIERLVDRVQADALEEPMALMTKVGVVLRDLYRVAPEGSAAEQACEFLLPKIEEALR